MLDWFADGDLIAVVDAEPGGERRVRLEDVRYAWASAEARGMWGIEARVGADGALLARPRRFARRGPDVADFERLSRLLRGRLPRDPAWHRPAGCDPRD